MSDDNQRLNQVLTLVTRLEPEITKLKTAFYQYLNGDPIKDKPGAPERIRQLEKDAQELTGAPEEIRKLKADVEELKRARASVWERWLHILTTLAVGLGVIYLASQMGLQ